MLHKVDLSGNAAQEVHLPRIKKPPKNCLDFAGVTILGRLRQQTVNPDFSPFTWLVKSIS